MPSLNCAANVLGLHANELVPASSDGFHPFGLLAERDEQARLVEEPDPGDDAGGEVLRPLDVRQVGAREIRRSAHELGDSRGDGVQDLPRGGARRLGVGRSERRQGGVPAVGKPSREPTLELCRELGVGGAVVGPACLPVGVQQRTPLPGAPPLGERLLGNHERLQRRPAEGFLRQLHFRRAQRRAVRFGSVLFVGAAVGDVGAQDDQRGAIGGGVGGIWNSAREGALFYQGYAGKEINLTALTYYRCERIIEDIAEYSKQVFLTSAEAADRERAVQKLSSVFLPNQVFEIAFQTNRCRAGLAGQG